MFPQSLRRLTCTIRSICDFPCTLQNGEEDSQLARGVAFPICKIACRSPLRTTVAKSNFSVSRRATARNAAANMGGIENKVSEISREPIWENGGGGARVQKGNNSCTYTRNGGGNKVSQRSRLLRLNLIIHSSSKWDKVGGGSPLPPPFPPVFSFFESGVNNSEERAGEGEGWGVVAASVLPFFEISSGMYGEREGM